MPEDTPTNSTRLLDIFGFLPCSFFTDVRRPGGHYNVRGTELDDYTADRPDPLPLVLAEADGGGSSNRSGRRRAAWSKLSAPIRWDALARARG